MPLSKVLISLIWTLSIIADSVILIIAVVVTKRRANSAELGNIFCNYFVKQLSFIAIPTSSVKNQLNFNKKLFFRQMAVARNTVSLIFQSASKSITRTFFLPT